MYYKSITLSKFLARYLNFGGEELRKLTHADVKELFPQIERCSYDIIDKNPELLAKGYVMMVTDGRNTIPYKVPSLDYLKGETLEINRKTEPPILIKECKYNYSKMSVYELKCLLTRKFNASKNRRDAKKELEDRGVVLSKKYVRQRDNKKVENMEE